jgi:hypothetical protein
MVCLNKVLIFCFAKGIPPKEKGTVTVLDPLSGMETGINLGHHLFEDPEEIAGMIGKTPEHIQMVHLSQNYQI